MFLLLGCNLRVCSGRGAQFNLTAGVWARACFNEVAKVSATRADLITTRVQQEENLIIVRTVDYTFAGAYRKSAESLVHNCFCKPDQGGIPQDQCQFNGELCNPYPRSRVDEDKARRKKNDRVHTGSHSPPSWTISVEGSII